MCVLFVRVSEAAKKNVLIEAARRQPGIVDGPAVIDPSTMTRGR